MFEAPDPKPCDTDGVNVRLLDEMSRMFELPNAHTELRPSSFGWFILLTDAGICNASNRLTSDKPP